MFEWLLCARHYIENYSDTMKATTALTSHIPDVKLRRLYWSFWLMSFKLVVLEKHISYNKIYKEIAIIKA